MRHKGKNYNIFVTFGKNFYLKEAKSEINLNKGETHNILIWSDKNQSYDIGKIFVSKDCKKENFQKELSKTIFIQHNML